ncbi:MAG: GGDEF domain-containing protein [Stenotrophomonas sp.]
MSAQSIERLMITTLLVGMLCVYLLSFTVMFLLISRRLRGEKMGMDVFAVGNLMLGGAYVLQLLEGAPGWNLMSVANHTLTLCSLLAYCVGGARFFGLNTRLWRPLLCLALGYCTAQVLANWGWGSLGRYAMLAATCAVCFVAMMAVLVHGMRSFARDLRGEMLLFAGLISGICVLNVIKLVKLLSGGLAGLAADQQFQMVFYVYMCSLATILPPSIVWLVLRRLTDTLRATAASDPMTQLLNRRGLSAELESYFRRARLAHLLLIDVDHFKHINDNYGHHVGDAVLCGVADALRGAVRKGDLVCRLGGEEFVAICVGGDDTSALALAERVREAIEHKQMLHGPGYVGLRCTVTIGVSGSFDSEASLDRALQEADAALYRGKHAGRNRVEVKPASAETAPGRPLCIETNTSSRRTATNSL